MRARVSAARMTACALGVAGFLAGCGGGGDAPPEGWLAFNGGSVRVTADATTSVTGTAFLPAGASCYYYSGPFAPPGCVCDIADNVRLDWSNAATGGSGSVGAAYMTLMPTGTSCRLSDQLYWRVLDIPLATGANAIRFTLSDGSRNGSATLSVTRN